MARSACHLHDTAAAHRRCRPAARCFFLGGRLERRRIVRDQGGVQVFGHAVKPDLLRRIVDQAAAIDRSSAPSPSSLDARHHPGAADPGSDVGRAVPHLGNRLITTIAGYYVAHGTWLLIPV